MQPRPHNTIHLVLVTLFALTSSSIAETISVNFNNGGATLLEPTDEVGFVPAANWNNFRNNGGLGLFNPDPTELIDSSGAISDAVISWEVGASFFNRNNGVGNQRMMEGWFGLNDGDDGYILIEDLPSSFTTASYDAYVYFDSNQSAPNERTMTFTSGDLSIVGKEMPANFGGTFFEASDGSAGNFVVFRDLTDPIFQLTADSDNGRAAITGIQLTTEPEPEPNEPPDPNAPIHVYLASSDGNSNNLFADNAGQNNWSLAGAELIDVNSLNTNISSAYRLSDPSEGFGGDASPFPGGNVTYELWVRPGENTDGHQVVFETGGGQNGTSILLREDALRLLNSSLNERGFDMEVSLDGVDTSDFLQIVATLNQTDGEISVTVNGSAGGTASASDEGIVGRGGNRASLFTWGSGLQNLGVLDDMPGGTFNLGGRTELEDMTPEDLTPFAGDIAMMNVFSRLLSPEDIQASFDALVNVGPPGDFNANGELDVDDLNRLSAAIRAGTNESVFDLDSNNEVDRDDREMWVRNLKNTWFGDANLDGEFNSSDFVQVFSAGKFETDEPADWEQGDWDGDHVFDTSDFVKAFTDGGFELGPRQAVNPVPEPSGTALLISCLSMLLLIRRKR